MQLLLHGGKCCGIKHIWDLDHDPDDFCCAKPATPKLAFEGDMYISSPEPFFWPAAPEETKGERLDRYLEFLDEERPEGICEIVLADWQLCGWRSFIEERGFVQVNKCRNCNSGDTIHVFHRNKE